MSNSTLDIDIARAFEQGVDAILRESAARGDRVDAARLAERQARPRVSDILAAAAHDRAIVRDLMHFATTSSAHYCYGLVRDIPEAPALSADVAMRRFASEIHAGDWHRIAESDPDDLRARLPEWREQGRSLLARDADLVADYAAAQAGDESARDRLGAPESEGGWGDPYLARAAPQDTLDRSGMTVAEAVQDLVDMANQADEDWAEDHMDEDDYEDHPPTYG